MNLYIVRHAMTKSNMPDNVRKTVSPAYAMFTQYGDVPISVRGELQALLVGKHFENIKIDKILSSPMARALMTAAAIASFQKEHLPIEILCDLTECWAENFEILPKSELDKIYDDIVLPPEPSQTGWSNKLSNEDEKAWWARAKRVEKYLKERLSSYENVVVVTHSKFAYEALCCALLQLNFEQNQKYKIMLENASVTKIVYKDDNTVHVEALNETGHLFGCTTSKLFE